MIFWAGLVLALFQLFVPVLTDLFDMQLRALHVALATITIMLAVPLSRNKVLRGLDVLLMVVVLAANILIFVSWQDIITYPGNASRWELVLGFLLVIVLIDAARRASGWAIPVMVLLMFVYVFAGAYMPGMWAHPGFPLEHVIETLYYSGSGIYSSLTGTSATFIAMFILFGALLEVTGGGKTFMDFALWAAGRMKGGPAQVCVAASAGFGMISGSAVANVSVTGNYTIPLMRKLGYHPNFAGGVESMSSVGGSLSPPIMGIASFIMADLLAVPYIEVMKYAIIPCVLFYTGIVAGIHFEAQRIGLAPLPREAIPRLRDICTWANTAPLVIPVIVLMGLLFADYTLLSAGFYACLAAIGLHVFSSRHGVRERARATVKALSDGGLAVAQIAPLLIAVAMFTALLGLTGVAAKVSAVILEMGGEYLLVSLVIAAIIPLVLGAPLPVAATYILSAALIAPALIRLKLDPAAVHMFLLYWATLASVTPPTCTACVVAANIAGGDWFKTSLVGMRLGIVAFIVPFFFVLNPALIWRGPAADIVLHGTAGLAGAVLLAGGFFGYLLSPLNWLLRVLYLGAGALLLAPYKHLLVIGVGLAVATLVVESLSRLRRT
ncbi:MAG TPA: TRAP transporter fused permease subunit [Burkholderiales bacterium]|nr:TRAP transporter fused permease subunit [Burkholderiales bacterium]